MASDVDNQDVIKRLRQLPQLDPPPSVVTAVMNRLQPPKRSFWQRVAASMSSSYQLTLHPLPVAMAAGLLLAVFWAGMWAGSHRLVPGEREMQVSLLNRVIENEAASFLVGRTLLAQGLETEALPFLQRVALAAPDNPEYAYWEGLCYWANGMVDKERESYRRAIAVSPESVPLRLNLGHNLLEQKQYRAALDQYERVLAVAPEDRQALYNRGLIYNLMGDGDNEAEAWKNYLQKFRTGTQAFRAVERLNTLDDFSYRVYHLGYRRMILSQAALLEPFSPESSREITMLSDGMRQDQTLILDIVVFDEGNEQQAKQKTKLLKEQLIAVIGESEKKRVRLSWFGVREGGQGSVTGHQHAESLLLLGRRNSTLNKETEI